MGHGLVVGGGQEMLKQCIAMGINYYGMECPWEGRA